MGLRPQRISIAIMGNPKQAQSPNPKQRQELKQGRQWKQKSDSTQYNMFLVFCFPKAHCAGMKN
jgi:hypothetical protein